MQEAQMDVLAIDAAKAHGEWLKATRELEAARHRLGVTVKPRSESDVNREIREILTTYNTDPSAQPGNTLVKNLLIGQAKATAAHRDAQEAFDAAVKRAEACAQNAHDTFDRMVELFRKG